MSEIIYVLTNEAMPGLVKVSLTNDRMFSLIFGTIGIFYRIPRFVVAQEE